jgi:RNA polymerase sigma factor (sigma-70 family)
MNHALIAVCCICLGTREWVDAVPFLDERTKIDVLPLVREIYSVTMYKVYTTITSVDANRKFSPFIFEIAKNKTLDFLKKKRNIRSLEGVEIEDDALSVDEFFMEEEDKQKVHDAVNRLPEKYKDVITLFYFDELSYEEVAKKHANKNSKIANLINCRYRDFN